MSNTLKLYVHEPASLPEPKKAQRRRKQTPILDFAVGLSCGLAISAAALYLYVILRPF